MYVCVRLYQKSSKISAFWSLASLTANFKAKTRRANGLILDRISRERNDVLVQNTPSDHGSFYFGLAYLTYCARTVAENGEKDAFSVISDKECNAYEKRQKKNFAG